MGSPSPDVEQGGGLEAYIVNELAILSGDLFFFFLFFCSYTFSIYTPYFLTHRTYHPHTHTILLSLYLPDSSRVHAPLSNMSSHHTTSSSSSKPALTLRISSILATAVLLLLTTTTLTPVSAKGGHFPGPVTDTSGPCIKRCSGIYDNEMTNCSVKFPNPNLDPYGWNNCHLDVAILFEKCSQLCIPLPTTLPDSQ